MQDQMGWVCGYGRRLFFYLLRAILRLARSKRDCLYSITTQIERMRIEYTLIFSKAMVPIQDSCYERSCFGHSCVLPTESMHCFVFVTGRACKFPKGCMLARGFLWRGAKAWVAVRIGDICIDAYCWFSSCWEWRYMSAIFLLFLFFPVHLISFCLSILYGNSHKRHVFSYVSYSFLFKPVPYIILLRSISYILPSLYTTSRCSVVVQFYICGEVLNRYGL